MTTVTRLEVICTISQDKLRNASTLEGVAAPSHEGEHRYARNKLPKKKHEKRKAYHQRVLGFCRPLQRLCCFLGCRNDADKNLKGSAPSATKGGGQQNLSSFLLRRKGVQREETVGAIRAKCQTFLWVADKSVCHHCLLFSHGERANGCKPRGKNGEF